MLIPIFEAYGIIDSYELEDTLEANATAALQSAATIDTNLPYGGSTTGFTGGMVCQLYSQSGSTVLVLTDGTAPFGMFADDFTDTLKSGKASFYYLCDNNKFKVKSNYDTSQTYVVNTLLTVVPSGTNQAKLTPASNYSSQTTVAIVMEAPSNAANDDYMIIQTDLQY